MNTLSHFVAAPATGDFLSIAVRLLRKKQLERRDVQEKLRQLAERREVAR